MRVNAKIIRLQSAVNAISIGRSRQSRLLQAGSIFGAWFMACLGNRSKMLPREMSTELVSIYEYLIIVGCWQTLHDICQYSGQSVHLTGVLHTY